MVACGFLFFRSTDFDYQFDDTVSPASDVHSPVGGPFTPQTPGTAYSPYGPSPSSSYQGRLC